jgi:hypothetical protein
MKVFGVHLSFLGLVLFAALPATTNYQLNSYGFGTGGTANSTTSTYALEGTTGEVSGSPSTTTTYTVKPGFTQTQQAHIPKITIDNGSGTYYNKLHFVIDQQNNPSDALYAISISTDNFASDIRYVKSDMTVSNSLVVADYQTYTAFGGASGANIIGLNSSTTYYVRVKATQGKFTESAYGPIASVATVGAQLSFSLSTTTVAMGALLPATVVPGNHTVDITFATNAASGGDIYISGQNGGLKSARTGVTIASGSFDLSAQQHGFGAQISAIGASTGTFSKVNPYDQSSNTVGVVDATIRRIMTTAGPITGGTGSVTFKAKATATDPAAPDYTEQSTMLASANF